MYFLGQLIMFGGALGLGLIGYEIFVLKRSGADSAVHVRASKAVRIFMIGYTCLLVAFLVVRLLWHMMGRSFN